MALAGRVRPANLKLWSVDLSETHEQDGGTHEGVVVMPDSGEGLRASQTETPPQPGDDAIVREQEPEGAPKEAQRAPKNSRGRAVPKAKARAPKATCKARSAKALASKCTKLGGHMPMKHERRRQCITCHKRVQWWSQQATCLCAQAVVLRCRIASCRLSAQASMDWFTTV